MIVGSIVVAAYLLFAFISGKHIKPYALQGTWVSVYEYNIIKEAWLASISAIIIDPVRCPNALREFTNYEPMKDKYGEIIFWINSQSHKDKTPTNDYDFDTDGNQRD